MLRHDGGNRIELAYAAPAPKVVGKQALAATLRQQQVAIPTPSPVRSLVPPAPIAEVASVEPAAVDPVTTSSTQSFDGWVIQLGAMPDRDAAMNLLSRAQGAAGRTLASAEPFTVSYENLYRARFGGFSGQDSAVAACRTLKKKGFACWATQN
jgi:D-alanyl-D-alanine carboxypeptidase